MIFRNSPFAKAVKERPQALPSACRFRYGRLPQAVAGIFLLVSFVVTLSAQVNENEDDPNESFVEIITKPAPVIYDPGTRMDPFLYIAPKTAAGRSDDEEVPRGIPPRGIEGTYIEKAGFEGIIVTRNDNRRMAIIRSADNRAYFLREGDRLFDGYLKTIDNDSVVFVRETLMRSGRILTQEVTKRLREL